MLKNGCFIECKMDLSILVPNPQQTLFERFSALKNAGISFEPYDGDAVNEAESTIVNKIVDEFYQDTLSYSFGKVDCFFKDSGRERVIALIFKTRKCELYQRGIESAENLGIPVFESREEAQIQFGKGLEGFTNFSAELHLIEGRPESFNGSLDSEAHYFILPSVKYASQNCVQTAVS